MVVAGPPCAGKTWLVEHNMRPGDVVLCVDAFAVEAGSPTAHNHPGRFYRDGQDRFWVEVARVRRTRHVRAWVIRCAPAVEDRRHLAMLCAANTTVVVRPPIAVPRRRAKSRDDPPDATLRAIDSWYRRFTPGREDRYLYADVGFELGSN